MIDFDKTRHTAAWRDWFAVNCSNFRDSSNRSDFYDILMLEVFIIRGSLFLVFPLDVKHFLSLKLKVNVIFSHLVTFSLKKRKKKQPKQAVVRSKVCGTNLLTTARRVFWHDTTHPVGCVARVDQLKVFFHNLIKVVLPNCCNLAHLTNWLQLSRRE